ncbi:putative signal-transduction protein containing cAMP-binding and CBS domains [Hyella patelloides LEGE 07179]|uniref:Putative signal-transduction protein containing cAMP-binding and CBS domains n=1 Tax=Hyella patelloides LEGE 07179 TaxID=945734 RepID=A0A563VK41_9CYAN|nr:CBS domain-containing protein [Hyella patelloides]VEP11791.1 putative signal-transduction protein containing cAMP-binding and CBS domains [Hyella patelloides LEGE 07179]
MKAADIMSTNVVTIDSLATLAEAARVMQRHNIRALIVDRTSDKDAYGIITQTDLAKAIANSQNPKVTYVYEVMTKPCIVVNPDLATEHIARLFARAKIRTAPVIKDKLIGLVSLTDILTKTDCLYSNNCLSSIEAELIPQKTKQPAEPDLEDWADSQWDSEENYIYENWCSG